MIYDIMYFVYLCLDLQFIERIIRICPKSLKIYAIFAL